MQKTTWTCDGCGRRHALRKIDSLRWVTSAIDPKGEPLNKERQLELCPSCRIRLLKLQSPEIFDMD
jgi:ribosomal protein L37AE/L43A